MTSRRDLHTIGNDEHGDQDDAGFTLVEQIVVLGVLSIVLIIVFGFMTSATETTTRADASVRAEQQAINALRTVTEDLRSTGEDKVLSCAGFTMDKCVTVEISKVTGGTLTCPKRVLKYWVDGTDLKQQLTDYAANCTTVTKSGTRTLISGVQSTSIFTYYKADGVTPLNLATEAGLAKDTPAIKVALSVKFRNNAPALEMSSFASLRNNRKQT